MNWKAAVVTGAVGMLLWLGAASPAEARHDRCFDRVRNEQWKLERDFRRHGFFSRQVQNRREKIFRLERSCSRDAFRHRRNFRNDRYDRFDRNNRRYFRGPVIIIPRRW